MEYIMKPRKKRGLGKYILIFIILFVMAGLTSLAWYGYNISVVKGSAAQKFVIEEGQGANHISRNLYQAGVIRSKLAFETYLYFRNLDGSIKAGTYQLPAVNIVKLTKALLEGPPPPETRLTFIEGWTLADYANELDKSESISSAEFLDIVSHPVSHGFDADNYPILYSKSDQVDIEGYLFPDTYRLFEDATAQVLVKVMLDNLTNKVTKQMATDIDSQGKTFHEVLTMASIIEKEVRTDRDRKLVSGVLWSRIGLGIPLQVDSTVNYITGESKPAVSIAETRIDNPFNTYVYRGLPPGPIANPSLSSIMAAIYPTDSEFLFYLSTPAGETIFSENLEQHNEAKNKYLK